MDEHEYDPKELCEHGRHIGAVCIPCSVDSVNTDEFVYEIPGEDFTEELKQQASLGTWKEKADLKFATTDAEVRTCNGNSIDRSDCMLHDCCRCNSGLNSTYYDFPENVRCAQDLIEFLDLNFSQGNILKSLVRENNPNAKKETTPLYESEKRYYYADRDLQNVRKGLVDWGGPGPDVEEGLETTKKE